MKTRWRFAIILILFGVGAMPAQQAMHKHAPVKSPSDPAWTELQSSMDRMHAAMTSVAATGNSDADFTLQTG